MSPTTRRPDRRSRAVPFPVPRSLFPLVVLLAVPVMARAQSEPVLKQINVPHSYYYREMYLPQATSGAASPTWSPDGKTLIYSMQGSLWRQQLGDTVAEQLTDGPGYDGQPDWSPDGRWVVYSSYHDDAIELRVLELATLVSQSLLAGGAVHVEPRWSPDGGNIAFVSTAFEGRWHIYLLPMKGGQAAGPPVRLTSDHDSGLPRYYYSRFDHYLSPTWSPDGASLMLVSNAGHIWGTGGIWRMEAREGGAFREIRNEETTWKARPDWSHDGKRVVYSSYLGGQWHQLWLMTAEGGDPLQLTYGDFDATEPRWSPNGERIAYVSNERGLPTLQVITVPGGRREAVRQRLRIFRRPVGQLLIRVDDARGRPLPARISVTLSDGRGATPDAAWRHASDRFDRGERHFEATYFHSDGSSRLTLPAGQVKVLVSHGPEYTVVDQMVTVRPGTAATVRFVLARLADLPASGWWSGDLHMHMNYGGTYRNTPAHLALQARAEDLHVVENLLANKEGRIPDIAYAGVGVDPVSTKDLILAHDQEFHTSYWGHLDLVGLRHGMLLPGYAGYVNTAAASLAPSNTTVIDLAHADGALAGYAHPMDFHPDSNRFRGGFPRDLPVDVALGKADFYEAVGFVDSPWDNLRTWYQLLNCGFHLPAAAGSDAMANYASLHGPVGLERVFVQTRGPLTRDGWLAGLRAGRTFATNGPLLEFSLSGRGIGSELTLPAGSHRLSASVSLRSNRPVDHLEIVSNGEIIAALPLRPGATRLDTTVMLTFDQSTWVTLRAWGDHAAEPILDSLMLATTSPVYLTVGGRPIRSADDARYFMWWIDRLKGEVEASTTWNSEAERRTVLGQLAAARAEFEKRQ